MISRTLLLTELQRLLKKLEDDLRARSEAEPGIKAKLSAQYAAAKTAQRTAAAYPVWRDELVTQVGVAWILGCVFVRFLEDNDLLDQPFLSGPGDRRRSAEQQHDDYFRAHPVQSDRDYLEHVFRTVRKLPTLDALFDDHRNALWQFGPSGDAATELLRFWQAVEPDTGALRHDFTTRNAECGTRNDAAAAPDSALRTPHSALDETRFLGDLYQDLSESARKQFALLQTPQFIEEFILDRTLTPALEAFGLAVVRMIDPTCGSGHFVLGGFDRLLELWRRREPGTPIRELVQRTLDALYGVDLNPFAVAIARFRLLIAALRACDVRKLRHAPAFRIHVATGDSLLHGRRFRAFEGENAYQPTFDSEEAFRDELKHHYEVEDVEALHRILGQQYHAVVGNPPYITVKDCAVSELYRARYPSCHRQYSLSVPFMERFFDLAVKGDGTPQQPAGFVGQITASSFMKREFGKKLIEEYLPRWDLTHVIDTGKAHIPGHATGTVILLGKNQPPVASTIRVVMGLKKQAPKPEIAEQGLAWLAILAQVDSATSDTDWVSTADFPRVNFHRHPWSIGGGGAVELKLEIDGATSTKLENEIVEIGYLAATREDEAFVMDRGDLVRHGVEDKFVRPFIEGEQLRHWRAVEPRSAAWPYDCQTLAATTSPALLRLLWPNRASLSSRVAYGLSQLERSLTWYEYSMFFRDRFRIPRSIAVAFVATHNQFVLDEGGKIFKQSSPVIKLRPEATEEQHIRLLGVLNSSAACFWMKQVIHDKGGGGIGGGISSEMWEHRFEFDGTKLKQLPIPARQPSQLPTALVQTSTALAGQSPAATLASWGGPESGDLRPWLASARDLATRHRRQLIAWQEELDWQIYEAFGLVEPKDGLSLPEGSVDLECPKGASSLSPGLPSPRGYPGSPVPKSVPTPTGLNPGAAGCNPVGVETMTGDAPRVGAAHQPWAEGCSPVGAGEVTPAAATFEVPEIELGQRAFEIVLARRMAAGEAQTSWFERHKDSGSKPITELPSHWPAPYRELVERRIARIASDPSIRLIEQPEYKRRWNTEPWDEQQERALRQWLLTRLEQYFHGGERMAVAASRQSAAIPAPDSAPDATGGLPNAATNDSLAALRAAWPAGQQPALVSTQRLADCARADAAFLAVAEVYRGRPDFDLPALVAELVADEAVPFLPVQRYKATGLRHREVWEQVWDLQRKEDAIDARIRPTSPQPSPPLRGGEGAGNTAPGGSAESGSVPTLRTDLPLPAGEGRGEGEGGWLTADEAKELKRREVGEIPVPPKYKNADFKPGPFWRLRGKLDVPKERWISYPGCERDPGGGLVIAWAGWDHQQQAQALSAWYEDLRQSGASDAKLLPVLAGLQQLIPWLLQWHNDLNPEFSVRMGDYFRDYVAQETRRLGKTEDDLKAVAYGG